MVVLSIRVKLANVAAVQGSHGADVSKHRRPARRRDQDQGFHRSLSFLRLALGLRKPRDVLARVLERDELAPARQRDRFFKRSFPSPTRRSRQSKSLRNNLP
jgi:hypothetical protein